jgi:hypothetical protein
MSLNTIEQDNILEIVARQEKRIAQLEAMLNGQSIRTARIADASITNIKIKDASITDAKIVSLSADKITAGEIIVAVDIGSPSSGYIRLDGDNNRIIVNDGTTNRVLISTDTFRVSLPTINALTNTNPNNYAIYINESTSDILIKEKTRGSVTINSGTYDYEISHGLNYVPLCFVFIEISSGVYRRVDGADSFDSYYFTIDDSKIYLTNTTGSQKTFKYYIFYDEITSGSPTMTESDMALKITKTGKSTSSTNPNDYIFHSDLNTFKIIKSGKKNVTVVSDTLNQTFTEAHSLSFTPFVNAFFKLDDSAGIFSNDGAFGLNSKNIVFWNPKTGAEYGEIFFKSADADSTNITFTFDHHGYPDFTDRDITINYFCLEKI